MQFLWQKGGKRMKHGFIKAAAITPKIKVADPKYNGQVICEKLEEAYARGAKIIVFPELCITGYTCGDLFLQGLLLKREAKKWRGFVSREVGGKGRYFKKEEITGCLNTDENGPLERSIQ